MSSKAESDLAFLIEHANELFEFCDQVLEEKKSIEESDHFGFMLASFGYKQYEHFRSVVNLLNTGSLTDASIIARVMLEGMVVLRWVYNNEKDRNALLWRGYALVTDFKTIQKMKKSGEDYDPEYERELLDRIDELGNPYLTKKARNLGIEEVDDPFQDTWLITDSGEKITRGSMFREVGSEDLYALYSDFSQWPHWTPKGFGQGIIRHSKGMSFTGQSFSVGAQACSVAIHSMGHVLNIMDEYMTLGIEQELKAFHIAYLEGVGYNTSNN